MAWREYLRDERGRFATKDRATFGKPALKDVLDNPSAATVDDLLDAFHRVGVRKKPDVKALRTIDAELARREGKTELPPPDTDRGAARIDELVRRGRSYLDAYAEVHNADVGKLSQQQERAALGAAKGESTEQARRRAYRELVSLQYLQAEEATRGVMLSKRCALRGVDPRALWSAAPARASSCASDELKQWWESNGGRLNYASFKARTTGSSQARAKAAASAGAGAGRDFGV